MFNFWTVMYLLFVGLLAGYAARLLVKGADAMTWWQTMLLGIVGSFVGGLGAYVLSAGTTTRASSNPAGSSPRSSERSSRCSSGGPCNDDRRRECPAPTPA